MLSVREDYRPEIRAFVPSQKRGGEARPMLWGEFPGQRDNCHRNLQKLHGAGEMVS